MSCAAAHESKRVHQTCQSCCDRKGGFNIVEQSAPTATTRLRSTSFGGEPRFASSAIALRWIDVERSGLLKFPRGRRCAHRSAV